MTELLDKPLDEIIKMDTGGGNRRRGGGNRGGRGGKVRLPEMPHHRFPALTHPPRTLSQAPHGKNDGSRRRSRESSTPYGFTHRSGESVADIANAPSGERTLKCSSTTNPKKLAGSIAMVCEGGCGEAPLILALGASCVNQAVKAIAICRKDMLEHADPTYLSCFPSFRGHREQKHGALSLQCDKETKAPWSSSDVDLTVASSTNPSSTAGAIAGKIREGLKVAVRACGADAVNNAAMAVAFSREYLKNESIDVYFVPEFEKEPVGDGGERTVVMFRVCKAAGSAPTGMESTNVKSTAMES